MPRKGGCYALCAVVIYITPPKDAAGWASRTVNTDLGRESAVNSTGSGDHCEYDRTASDLHCELRSQRRAQDAAIFACDPSPPVLPDFVPGGAVGGPQVHDREARKTEFSLSVNNPEQRKAYIARVNELIEKHLAEAVRRDFERLYGP